jgi:hypothetical protein
MDEDSGMKQRCPVLTAASRRIVSFAFLVLGCVGCSKPPMFHITARSDIPIEGQSFKIFLKGQEIGTITGSGAFEFDAEGRQGDTLEQAQPQDLEARLPWVCGWVKTDSSLSVAQSDEIERSKAEHRAVQAKMSISYTPPSFDWVTIFVDNRGGPAQTVSIGDLQEQVPADATQRIMLPHSDSCDKAKDVRLNTEIVAPVNIHQTLLIDIEHSHCYREEWSGYGSADSGRSKTIYLARPFQFLDNNPDLFMETPPGVVFSPYSTTRSTLKEVPCSAHALSDRGH